MGIKVRDLGQTAIHRVYSEFVEYLESGKIPDYLL